MGQRKTQEEVVKKSVNAMAMVFATALIASSGSALEVSGVKFDDKINVAGVPLVFNGAGLRTKMMLKIYVVGLYVPAPTTSADAVIGSTQPRRVRLVLKRSLGAGTIWDAFDEGIQANNSPAELAALKPKLVQVENLFRELGEVAEGDAIDIDFTADGATIVHYKGQPKGSIAGTDLQRALLKIWLGPKPVQEDVKEALLRGR
jgi:long-chain acyl-CoA synthetase